jgi:hypothetical protein
MAEVVVVEGQQFKKRNPLGVWALGLITFGIYLFVWYYKVNDEARRYLKDESIKPAMSVLAWIPGIVLLYIPPLVSVYRSGTRIQRMQEKAGIAARISAVLTVILVFVLGLWVVYIQSELNKIWEQRTLPAAPPMPGV